MQTTTALKSPVLILCALAIGAAMLLPQVNAPSLDSDGTHYASVAKEIARTNQWLPIRDPISRGRYYWHFPLSVWPSAAIFELFGVSPATAKLYPILMCLATVAGLFVLGRILATPWAGWCAGVAFLITNHVLRIARQCRPDLPLIAFMTWAFVGVALALSSKPRRGWYLLAGLATLGAVMTKEMVGLVPLLSAAAFLILRRQWRELFHPLFLAAWAIAVLPVLGWIWFEQVRYGETLWIIYKRQSVDFFMHAEHLYKPWYYYGWAILDKYWYMLPLAIAGAWISIKKILKAEEPRWILIFLWAAAPPVMFSLANHKVHYYILPTYAAFALWVGLACEAFIKANWRPILVQGLTALAVAAGVALSLVPVSLHKARYVENVQLAPKLDELLKREPGEVVIVRQDAASLFIYTRYLTDLHQVHGWPSFQEVLAREATQRRYCLIAQADWKMLEPKVQDRWHGVLADGERLVLKQEPSTT